MSDNAPFTPDDNGFSSNPDRRDVPQSEATARRLAELHVDLGRQIAAATTSSDTLAAVTTVALKAVPGAHHASISRDRGERFQTLAPTDEVAYNADQLQYEMTSGPCVESVQTEGLFLVPDLAKDERWPAYGPLAAQRFGIGSMLSASMMLDDDIRASLNLYSDDVRGFTTRSETVAMVLTTHATVAINRVLAREHASNLEIALVNSRKIGTAMGVLMYAHKLTSEEAFAQMQTASQNRNRKLALIAEDVVDTGTLGDL